MSQLQRFPSNRFSYPPPAAPSQPRNRPPGWPEASCGWLISIHAAFALGRCGEGEITVVSRVAAGRQSGVQHVLAGDLGLLIELFGHQHLAPQKSQSLIPVSSTNAADAINSAGA